MGAGESWHLLGHASPQRVQQSTLLKALMVLGLIFLVVIGQSVFSGSQGSSTCVGRPLRLGAQPGFLQNVPACNASTVYLPSDLEQAWLTNAAAWEKSFCNNMAAFEDGTKVWLDVLAEHTALQEQYLSTDTSPAEVLAQQQKMDPRVFSRFVTTFYCDGKETQHITYIEPLSHGLRHPNALCNRGTDVMDRKYLLPAHRADHATASKLGNVHCQNRTCQAMYFDLGATTLQSTPDEAGQGWFFNAYQRQGIVFDRFFLWEAVTQAPAEVFKNVPKADMHKYQYFNVPVTSDAADMSNPVNILKTIAQPGDFIVFKLDIDNYSVEHAIFDALKADTQALALVDEFYFEEHVSFGPMLPYWADSVGPGTSLASSYAMFHLLRQKGLRAHSWV